ncbi:hypothetical protein CC86DRAFT_472655 [Ophiobolus disseminans]|uniref:NACHT-NTPase and P-loop NTPases N-terminal domain-containing protein n=1 Tax=Ophiobolus disseminans TaxID=1469910 RepID=A0A6A6ZD59_9PLEO|nr:hypothetical protein CC86DRAFT_472655 [Ophiobolus disseminans]
MSFGIAIGDFIATGELIWKLYRQVYQVARGAPMEVQALQKELSDIHNVINAIVEDAKQDNYPIDKAGPDRSKLATDIMQRTKDIALSLQGLLERYDFWEPGTGVRKKFAWKLLWSKIKYASEVCLINDLRSKLAYQNGILTLLLLAANNSSLERITSQNDALMKSVESIKSAMHGVFPIMNPTMTNGAFDEQSQYEVANAFLAKAEVHGQLWSTVGINDWIQAGKWWLMKVMYHAGTITNIFSQDWNLGERPGVYGPTQSVMDIDGHYLYPPTVEFFDKRNAAIRDPASE